MIDSRARDGFAVLAVLDGQKLEEVAAQAAALLATVLGQDLQEGDDGVLRIARRVAKDRVISTVDPQARHGHKTAARGFDGYKGHVAMDPDSEIITATTVTPGNTGDATPAPDLVAGPVPRPGRHPRPGLHRRPRRRHAGRASRAGWRGRAGRRDPRRARRGAGRRCLRGQRLRHRRVP
ncbi:MAG: transposase [Pseudonocardiaceae bacterium]